MLAASLNSVIIEITWSSRDRCRWQDDCFSTRGDRGAVSCDVARLQAVAQLWRKAFPGGAAGYMFIRSERGRGPCRDLRSIRFLYWFRRLLPVFNM